MMECTEVMKRCIKVDCEVGEIKTLFLFPKLIFVKNSSVLLIHLCLDNEDNDILFDLEEKIMDIALQRHLLWILLQSGKMVIVDVLQNKKLSLDTSKLNYKVKEVCHGYPYMGFISESEESFKSSLSVDHIKKTIETGLFELELKLEKTHPNKLQHLPKCDLVHINGLQIGLDDGLLYTECPVTGLGEYIDCSENIKLKKVLSWDGNLILSNLSRMWILDFNNNLIVMEYKAEDIMYYPVGAYLETLYFLTFEQSEVKIQCIKKLGDTMTEDGKLQENGSQKESQSQDILKLQLKSIVDEYIKNVPDNMEDASKKLKPYFDTIEDTAFLTGMVKGLCDNFIICKHIIYPLQKRLAKANDFKNSYIVSDIIFKIDIIEYIEFTGNNAYKNLNFFDCDFIDLCVIFLSNSDFDVASLYWLKYSEIRKPLTCDEVLKILMAISPNSKMGSLIIWMKNFVPSLLSENPYYVDIFVRWTTERVFLLEKSAYWPKIGIKFIDDIRAVLESYLKTVIIMPISMDDLDVLRDRIIQVMELKEKYKINMLLNELSNQNPNEIVLIMLHRCYTEDLESFLKEYISNYTTRYCIDLDDILKLYIQSEASSGGGNIDEQRFSIMLGAFRMPSQKLECLLNVLRVLDVPWNNKIQDIATEAAALSTNDFTLNSSEKQLAQYIEEELNYANLKVVLKKYNFALTCTDYMLVLHKIINTPTVNVQDLQILIGAMPAQKYYASILYINRCLQDCDTKQALSFFASLHKAEAKVLLKALISKYEYLLDKAESDKVIMRCYIDFFKGSQLVEKTQIKMIENMYHLKTSHKVTKSLNDMHSENKLELELLYGQEQSQSEENRSLSQLLDLRLTHNAAILNLLHRTSTSAQVRKFIEALIVSSGCSGSKFISEKTITVLSSFLHGNNLKLLVDSHKVIMDLISNCEEEHLFFLTNILYVLNSIVNTNITVRNLSAVWKFNYILLPMSSSSTGNDLINLYSNIAAKSNLSTSKLSSICGKNDFVSLRVLSNTVQTSKNLFDEDFNDFKERLLKRLIMKMAVSTEIDELLLSNLLLVLETLLLSENRQTMLIDILKGQNEVMPANLVAYLSSAVTRRTLGIEDEFSHNAVSYSPHYLLKNKFNLNLGEIALPDVTEETWDVKIILFYILKQNVEMPLDRLIDICRTLNISMNDGLSLQLIAILSSWDLKYETYTDNLGRRQIEIKNNETQLISKCTVIWESLKNKDFLKDILQDFWKNGEVSLHGRLISINPYFYETYLCIYFLLQEKPADKFSKEYYLLNFLKNYRRRSSPQQYEYELFSVKGMFPEIGHYRLPFHLFLRDDMWLNLKSEITLETYEIWLPAVALLSLDSELQTARDMICSNALKQTMRTRKPSNVDECKDSEPWRLSTKEEPLLRAAHRCVRHIANMEWAGACLFYVLQGCARGADQVAAAQLCYQFAQRWDAVQPGNRAVKKMEHLHSTLSTRHVLHKIDWASEELVHLSVEPVQLIRNMYLHPKLVEKIARYDINAATNEIADKNGINISTIRIQILESILEKSNDDKSSKKSITLSMKELLTAKYILKATCPKMGAIYLSRIVYDDETDFNKCKKLRALQSLMSIVDADTALKVTNRDREVLWSTVLEMFYSVNLENTDMPWAVEMFMQDKTKAIEQICASVGSQVEGLKLTANLLNRYGNKKSIVSILPQLLRAALYEEVTTLLLKVQFTSDEICTAWSTILLAPFQTADYPITERQKLNCIKVMNLLPLCPAIKDDVLKEIWKHCVRCKSYGIACLMLPYMTYEARASLPELQRIDRRNLIASLKNLQTETFLVSGAMFVLESMVSKNYR